MNTLPQAPPPPQQMNVQTEPPKQRNVIGLIALIVAIIGAIFAVIPGALIIGWLLLPIAFILSIVSLFMRDQKRGQGISALVISIVGTIIGFFVFLAVVGSAFDQAFSEETQVATPQEDGVVDDADEVAEEAELVEEDVASEESLDGTRANPLPIGSTIVTEDWEITIDSVDLDATAQLSADSFNDAPDAGNGYILIGMTAKYVGSDPEGASPWASVKFVTSSGNTFDSLDSLVFTDDSFDSMETLYEGASTSGFKALEVPLEDIENGTLRVSPDLFADDKFFAIQ